ncbi:MAG: hypothetical protein AB7H80_13225 [Candidatus Kapaibacterium sp.]
MRFIWYIAFSIALWYLSKAVMRHYLSSNSNQRKSGEEENRPSQRRREMPTSSDIPYNNVRDANYRDVE